MTFVWVCVGLAILLLAVIFGFGVLLPSGVAYALKTITIPAGVLFFLYILYRRAKEKSKK